MWFLGTVAPGFLIIFYFLPAIAESYDFLKLLIFSISLSLPLIAMNLAISIAISRDQKHKIAGHWFDGSAAASVSTYISLYASYYYALNFPTFVFILLILNLVLAIFLGFISKADSPNAAP